MCIRFLCRRSDSGFKGGSFFRDGLAAKMQTPNNVPPAPAALPTDQARQGVTGHDVRYVPAFGLAGAVICVM